ncbi:MAG: S-layer homology domain-containing protein, partial [Firmicutes bacterium]|nr:S-layer homology domain-containing protein [Bacillota bacterium]
MKKKTISILLGVVMLLSGISVSYAVDMAGAADIAALPQQEQGTEPGNPPVDISGGIVIPSSVTGQQEAGDPGSADTGGTAENSDNSGEGEDLPGEDSHRNLSFDDVQNPSEYFYNPVYWAVKKGITQGTSDTEFSPNAICTRAQIVTFLWRKAGKPEPETASNPFKDVAETDYFYKAVLWAVEAKITSGTAEDRLGPDDQCTRAQCVTFLWRNYGSPAPEIGGVFNDVDSSAYYCQAVNWALEKGVTNGMSSVQFSPDTSCTRGQTVTLFYRASLENVDRQNVEGDVVTGAFIDSEVNGKNGTFTLRAENVSAESGIQSVRTAVWTKADRSDLHWYDMQGTDRSGSYQLPLSVRDFNTTFGIYHAKLYAVTALEQQVELDTKDTDVKAEGYMFTEALGNRQIRVTVMGVPDGNEVSFASWSDEKYLDDLFWTSGQNQGNGTWT